MRVRLLLVVVLTALLGCASTRTRPGEPESGQQVATERSGGDDTIPGDEDAEVLSVEETGTPGERKPEPPKKGAPAG